MTITEITRARSRNGRKRQGGKREKAPRPRDLLVVAAPRDGTEEASERNRRGPAQRTATRDGRTAAKNRSDKKKASARNASAGREAARNGRAARDGDARRTARPAARAKPGTGAKRASRKRAARTAATADRHELYQLSVQTPDIDAPFYRKFYKRYVGRPAEVFREDFCGTGYLACHWVMDRRHHRAIGVDIDAPTLAWGRRNNLGKLLDEEQRSRIELIQADVRTVECEPADIIAALNFSYSFFETRDELRGYLAHCRSGLRDDGLMILDAWGGSETMVDQEEEREVEDFVYVWDQHEFDPITHHQKCRIHFRFEDGTELHNAFKYEWRLWTLPELQELMREAGFRDVHVLWEGTDTATGEGNGVYRRRTKGEADPAWIAYVIGQK